MGAQNVPEHLRTGIAFGPETGCAAAALQQIPGVPRIARQRCERRCEQHSGGKILGQHEQAVAFHVVSFHGRSAAGGVGIVMLHHGFGNVEALPSGPAGAQAEIGILAIQEKAGVESAGLFEQGAAVEGGRSAGEKRLFGHGKILRRPAMAALLAAGVAGNQHAGGIEAVFAEKADLRSAHAHVRPLLNRPQQGIQPVRPRNGVVIERRQVGGSGGAQSLVNGLAKTEIAGVFDHTGVRRQTIPADQTLAAIVYYDHFEVAPGLQTERLQTFREPQIRRKCRDYDGDTDFWQSLFYPMVVTSVVEVTPKPTL
jgi:hypothetical protein